MGMKATRHNGRAGKFGAYNVKHNDRNFDVTVIYFILPEPSEKLSLGFNPVQILEIMSCILQIFQPLGII